MRFHWDPSKAAGNERKHRVGFAEACTIFADRSILSLYDGAHSEREDRWVSMGMSEHGRIMVVVHTWERAGGREERVRIISALLATRSERGQYLERRS